MPSSAARPGQPPWAAHDRRAPQRTGTVMRAYSYAATHVGTVRTLNEDRLVNLPELGLWAVADGAGGHAAGEVASGMLAEALQGLPPTLAADEMLNQIRAATVAVHGALRAEAERRGDTMIASTLVVLVLRDGFFATLWSGDSRVYLLREGALTRVTRDHSLVQSLVDQGVLTPAQAEHHPQANVITRAIGAAEDNGELDKVIGRVMPGDHYLLCSDGLNKAVDDADIAALLRGHDPAEALIAAALERGARDNVTAVVVVVPEGGA
jgi:serine/threonine protein phosphatase Stp1